MTDLEMLIRMLDRAKIVYEIDGTENGKASLSIYAGYQGFLSQFTFGDKDQLLAVEAYE